MLRLVSFDLEPNSIAQLNLVILELDLYLTESNSMPFSMLTLFRMGLFGAAHRLGSGQKGPLLPNICQTYPTMIKLAIVILYLKKIQKIYESHDRPLEFCWHQHFFISNQQFLLYQEMQI